jgi:uncharacterized repeat protein (TIGR01451 family)
MKGTNRSPKWRRLLIAVTLAAVVVLGLVVTIALAQPPPGGGEPFPSGAVFFQTSGPNTHLNIGDWYTNNNTNNPPGAGPGGNEPHEFLLFVPCAIPPTSPIQVFLFDPELWPGTGAIDEIRDANHTKTQLAADADDATFTLLAPDNSVVVSTTFPPTIATEGVWVPFTTITRGAFNCAAGDASVAYTLRVTTSDNDDNSWRVSVTHLDATPGTGDEVRGAIVRASFQHGALRTDPLTPQEFSFFVEPGTSSVTLNNFDLDVPGYTPNATVTYFQPDGSPGPSATTSGNAVWNNGTSTTRGGDVIPNPQTGWWRAEFTVGGDNQYIFEAPRFHVPDRRDPEPALSQQCFGTDQSQIIRYGIDFENTSADSAGYEPVLTFSLPAGTTFDSCIGIGGLPCSETQPGQVTFTLPPVLPILAEGGAGQGFVDVRWDAGTPDPLVSTAEFDYTDVYNNNYDPLVDTFTTPLSQCIQQVELQISKDSDLSCHEPGESQSVNYTINYANQGTGPAVDATVTDTLPGATTFVSCSGGQSCSEQPPGSSVVVYSLGTLDPGATGSLGLTVQVDAGATGSLTNRAQLEAVDLPAVTTTDVLPVCTDGTPSNGGPPGIPEPTTLALVGLGLAGLAGYARRRRQRRAD